MRRLRELLQLDKARERTRATLCAAMEKRRVIEFSYHGGYRTVEPFCLGIVRSGDADNESLLCYQTGGFSDLRESVGWKLYRASEIRDIEQTGDTFTGNRPCYAPDDIGMESIYCRVIPVMPAVPEAEPVSAAAAVPAPRRFDHNELMRRFRFGHPAPVPELYTHVFLDPLHSPFPEPPESKNTPLDGNYDWLHWEK